MATETYELQFEYSPRKLSGGIKPTGTRSLSCLVREDVYFHAKAQAAMSGLRLPEFVARVLATCQPINIGPEAAAFQDDVSKPKDARSTPNDQNSTSRPETTQPDA